MGEIGRRIRSVCASAIFHVDATQVLGRIPVDLDGEFASVDLLSLSAHKFHGPKGIGALVALDDLSLPPIIHGTQQGGRRGGTLDAAAAAALAVSARVAREQLPWIDQVLNLRDRFESVLAQAFPQVRIIGQAADRLPNTSCFVIAGLGAEAAVEALAQQGIVVAMGSACTSGSPAPSHVLTAMGLTYAEAKASLRVSLSRETTWQELQLAIEALQDVAALTA